MTGRRSPPGRPLAVGFSVKLGLLALAARLGPAPPAYFCEPERAHWQGVPSARRRLAYAGGRLAAKLAVHALRRQLGMPCPALAEILVLPRPGGAPSARLRDGSEYLLSISHTAGLACAVSFLPPWQIGLDVLTVAQAPPADPDWFHPRELGHPPRERAISWAIKEATVKALGRGLGPVFSQIACWTAAGHRYVTLPSALSVQIAQPNYTLLLLPPYLMCVASGQTATTV